MKYSLFVGRFSPPHTGHFAIIKQLLKEKKNVLIAIRITGKSKDNPYTAEQRATAFRQKFCQQIIGGRIKIINLPDIEEVVYGRKVGYKIRKIKMPERIEKISGTKIRYDNLDNRK